MADALQAARDEVVVHRDVKPGNNGERALRDVNLDIPRGMYGLHYRE